MPVLREMLRWLGLISVIALGLAGWGYANAARDPEMRAWLEGRSRRLPAFYRETLKARLGRYGELLSEDDLRPRLERPGAVTPIVTSSAPIPSKLVALGGRR